MANSVSRLDKALKQIAMISHRIIVNKFTEATFVQPADDMTLQLRQSYMVDLNVISENLDLKKDDPLREKYEELFKQATGLHGQCNILDHKYEVAGVTIDIDWKEVWKSLTDRLPNDVAPLLKDAIKREDPGETGSAATSTKK